MKKILSLLTMLLATATISFAQTKNIKYISENDIFAHNDFVKALGNDRYEIDSLVLSFNDRTFKPEFFLTLRDCCEKGRLTGIDMSRCNWVRAIPEAAFFPSIINEGSVAGNGETDEYGFAVNLRYITLPKMLKEIGENAFAYTNIEQIELPPLVRKIGKDAFAGCKKLHDVAVRGNMPLSAEDGHKFSGLPKAAVLSVARGMSESYDVTSSWAAFAKVNEADGLYRSKDVALAGTTLEAAMGTYNNDIDSLSISGTLTEDDFKYLRNISSGRLSALDISKSSFDICNLMGIHLACLRLPETMKTIPDDFVSGSQIYNLILPTTYEEIGIGSLSHFYDFADSTLIIPEGCRQINLMALYECYSIKTLHLPSSLEELAPHSLQINAGRGPWYVDIYINRITPPVSQTTVGETYYKYGPFGCGVSSTSADCPTHLFRLFVPVGAKQNYAGDEHWSHFAEIIETPLLTGTPDGILNVTTTAGRLGKAAAAGIYTLDGRCISRDTSVRPAIKGLYIIRENGVTKKVRN